MSPNALDDNCDEETLARARVAESPFHIYLKSLPKLNKPEVITNAPLKEYDS